MAISRYFVRFPGFFQEIAPQAFPSVTTGLRPRNDSASGKVVRIRRGAVVHWVHSAERHRGRSLQADFAPLRVGATLAVVPGPTIHGGGAAASRPPYSDSIVTSLRLGKL